LPIVIYDGAKKYAIKDFGTQWNSKENDVNQMEGEAVISFNGSKRIIGFARDAKANRNAPYAMKFAVLIDLIAQARKDGSEVMVIAEPWVIGDTHDEIIESLSRLGGTKIGLIILHRQRSALHNQN
jgi:hypothetical protein